MIRKSQSSSSILPQTDAESLVTDTSTTDLTESRSRIASDTSVSLDTSPYTEVTLKHTNLHIPHILLKGNASGSRKVNKATETVTSSGRDVYDKEEPLITKTTKYYKKRKFPSGFGSVRTYGWFLAGAPLVPLLDDSDDSYVADVTMAKWDTVSINSTFFYPNGDSDEPNHKKSVAGNDSHSLDEIDLVSTDPSFGITDDGIKLTESGFKSLRSDGLGIEPGMGFVSEWCHKAKSLPSNPDLNDYTDLHDYTAGRRLRLVDHGPQLLRPGDRRRHHILHWHPAAGHR